MPELTPEAKTGHCMISSLESKIIHFCIKCGAVGNWRLISKDDTTYFRCDNCGAEYPYEEWSKHWLPENRVKKLYKLTGVL
jgi:predicted RNA-binding Zn-ribbon protein involved in translation (DUF1610 family)